MSSARAVVLGALLALLGLLGCQAVLGDFEIERGTDDGSSLSCDGGFRCSEGWLYCANEDDGSWTQLDSCGSPDQCDSTDGRCTVCEVGDYRCNDAKLETCKADRSGWVLVQTCASADECNLNSRTCRACTPGEPPMCSGPDQTQLRECGDDQTWVDRDTCATKELCVASVEAAQSNPEWDGSCVPPGCPVAGAYQCDGRNLLRCPPSLTGFVTVDTCATEDLCASTVADPTVADALGGKCVMPVCTPVGALRCTDGNVLEACLEDQLGWGLVEACVDPFQCNTNERACAGPCKPGDRQCSGATLQICSPAQLWEPSTTCVSAALCEVTHDEVTGEWTGTCRDPLCPEPGVHRCTDGLLEICNVDQTAWEAQDTCASAALCNEVDGRCETPACAPGALQCSALNPSELLRCREDLTDWESAAICSSTQSCSTDPVMGPCIDTCPNPPEQCNGAVRETCSGVTGVPAWSTVTTCRSRELCECGIDGTCANGTVAPDMLCGAPVCGELLGGSRCSDDGRLQLCLPGRNGFDSGTACGSAALCVPGQKAMGPYWDGGYCAVCTVASEKACDGATLWTCSADRRNWQSSVNCGSLGCMDNGSNDYCIECTNGAKRCSGNGMGVQTCTQGRWSAAVACTGGLGCVDSGSNDYCADCTPGDKQCVTGGIQTCNAQSHWSATATCAAGLGCTNSGDNDYCTECTGTDRRCSGADLQSCSQGRWSTPATCTLGCFDATGNADYCSECTGSERRCDEDDAGLETCAQNQWGAAAACSLGCHDGSGNADYCAECTGSETRCSGDGLQTCSAERWGTAVDCASGCVDASGDDYCAECTPGDTACSGVSLLTCGTDSLWSTELCPLSCVESETDGEPAYCARCEIDEDCVDGGLCLLGLCVVI